MTENESPVTNADTDELEAFGRYTTDEKLNVIHAELVEVRAQINAAVAIFQEVGNEVAPLLESLKSNPMFKMLGIGKRIG